MGRSRLVVALAVLLLAGCGSGERDEYAEAREAIGKQQAMIADKKQMLMEQGYSAEEIAKLLAEEFDDGPIKFKDEVETNAELPDSLEELVFVKPSKTNPKGEEVRLIDLLGKKRIVLIVTRGFSGGDICPFCQTQTSQLANAYDQFTALNTEVLIVYPVEEKHLPEFLDAAAIREKIDIEDVRWDVVLDAGRSAVKLLDIAADLASPSTFLFDENGKVVLAYVGAGRADRPSVEAILDKIKQLDGE